MRNGVPTAARLLLRRGDTFTTANGCNFNTGRTGDPILVGAYGTVQGLVHLGQIRPYHPRERFEDPSPDGERKVHVRQASEAAAHRPLGQPGKERKENAPGARRGDPQRAPRRHTRARQRGRLEVGQVRGCGHERGNDRHHHEVHDALPPVVVHDGHRHHVSARH